MPTMRLIRNLLALLVLAIGALWSLQGLGIVRGSFMTDQTQWLYIGIVTMLSQLRDEYWLAGAVAATFTFANAIIAPQISRLVDKWGQSRLLIPTTAIAIVAFALMMMAADPKWPSCRRS